MRPRRHSSEQDARLLDAVVAPRFDARFARGLLDALPHGDRITVLELGCRTGRLASAMLRRLGATGRVVAVDEDEGLLDLARRRAFGDVGKRLFFKQESPESLSFGDDVFDVVVANLAWDRFDDPASVLREARRVLVDAGPLHMTALLRGSFAEVLDMIRELARAREDGAMAARLDSAERAALSDDEWSGAFETAGFDDVELKVSQWPLSFESAAALFEDPLLQVIAMPAWVQILGDPNDLSELERRMHVYTGGGPLSLTVRGGRVLAR